MSEEIDKKIIDETLEELGFEEHVSSLSQDKPREFWIAASCIDTEGEWEQSFISSSPREGRVHVIEKSAYDNEVESNKYLRNKINLVLENKNEDYELFVRYKKRYDKAVEVLKNIERDHPKTFLDVGDTLKDLGEKE